MISVRDRLVYFFALNPDEELTRADAVTKFGVSISVAWDALTRLAADGLLETTAPRARRVRLVYRRSSRFADLLGRGPR